MQALRRPLSPAEVQSMALELRCYQKPSVFFSDTR
jgi:hypothetical protein